MSHAITLAYNLHFGASAGPCTRVDEDGQVLGETKARAVRFSSLNRAGEIGMDQIQRDLSRFHRNVDRKILGSRFSDLPLERRSSYLAVVESMHGNIHVHLGWNLPLFHGDEHGLLMNKVQPIWRAIAPNGTSIVKPIHDQAGWARYMFKDLRGESDTTRIVVSGKA